MFGYRQSLLQIRERFGKLVRVITLHGTSNRVDLGLGPPVCSISTPIFLSLFCDRDTSNPPAQVTNPIGTILLGHVNADGSGGENLNISGLILARTRSIFTYHTIRDVTISL